MKKKFKKYPIFLDQLTGRGGLPVGPKDQVFLFFLFKGSPHLHQKMSQCHKGPPNITQTTSLQVRGKKTKRQKILKSDLNPVQLCAIRALVVDRHIKIGGAAQLFSYCYHADEVIKKWMMKMAKVMAKMMTWLRL